MQSPDLERSSPCRIAVGSRAEGHADAEGLSRPCRRGGDLREMRTVGLTAALKDALARDGGSPSVTAGGGVVAIGSAA